MFPTHAINDPKFYREIGFLPPILADKGKVGQMLIGIDTSSYWKFNSQDGNKDAPLILCLGVSPGVSSLVEMANGLGPFKSKVNYATLSQFWVDNDHGLTMKADVVFLDMMITGGYSKFYTTKHKPIAVQNDVYIKHILKLLKENFKGSAKNKKIFLHGTGYTTKFLPGLANLLKDNGYSMKGISASSPLLSPYSDIKGSYIFAVSNNMIDKAQQVEQEKKIEFLPILTKAKDDGVNTAVTKLQLALYGDKHSYHPVNMFNILEKCMSYHKACLRGEYPRTVFMNNPKFQMVSKVYKTKLEVIDLGFTQNPYNDPSFMEDVTEEYEKLLDDGVKVLFTSGEYSPFASWHGAIQAITNFVWKHTELFKNIFPNRLSYGFAKGAENLGFIKFDNAGLVISENQAKHMVDAIYDNLLGLPTSSKKHQKKSSEKPKAEEQIEEVPVGMKI